MSAWDTYEARLKPPHFEDPERTDAKDNMRNRMRRRITASLSYKKAMIDGIKRFVAIIDDSDFSTKKIFAMPGESIPHGGIVEWSNAVWLITELNAHNEFCEEGKMVRCNHQLKWIDNSGQILSRWCLIEDATTYMTGEASRELLSVGNARISLTIGKDEDTRHLTRGMRFLIDDADSLNVMAYEITKPNRLYNVFNGHGVYSFILTEVNLTDNDNKELRVADYYNWAPPDAEIKPDMPYDLSLEEIVDLAIEREEQAQEYIEDKDVWL